MFILQEKTNGKFRNVSGKFQYGAIPHAQRRAEKDYGGKLFWGTHGDEWAGMDNRGKTWYTITLQSSNPMNKPTLYKRASDFVQKLRWSNRAEGQAALKMLIAYSNDMGNSPEERKLYKQVASIIRKWLKDFATEHRGMARNPVGKKKATTITSIPGQGSTVKFYATDIVQTMPGNKIKLDSGGWLTATTKSRMNESADDFGLGFKVYSKGGTRKEPKWWVDDAQGKTHEFFDGIVISGPAYMNPKRKRTVAKKRRTAKQRAATKKLIAFNKKRRKKTGRKRTVSRKKTKRRVVRRRNPQKARPGLKKSHLWIVFGCTPKKELYYLTLGGISKPQVQVTGTKSDAILFKTKSQAKQMVHVTQKIWNKDLIFGICNENATPAEIKKACFAGK